MLVIPYLDNGNYDQLQNLYLIVEYGSTPYIGMAPKKMAAPLYVICSKLCPRLSHKLLWTIPVILECFQQ